MADPNDIRRFFSPSRGGSAPRQESQSTNTPDPNVTMQRNWRSRRRIVESDSDDNAEPDQLQQDVAANANDGTAAGNADAIEEPIIIESSDDDDDIWVRPPARLDDRQTRDDHSERQERGPPHAHIIVPATAQLERRRSSRLQAPPLPCSRRRRLEGEAEESTAYTGSSSDIDYCDESESDAEDLYRSAVAGVRNAQVARQQLRASTQHCPVCAQFSAFLQHFLRM